MPDQQKSTIDIIMIYMFQLLVINYYGTECD